MQFGSHMIMNNALSEIIVEDVASLASKSVVSVSCLDFPRLGQAIFRRLVVSGWLVKKDPSAELGLRVKNGDNNFEISLEVARPDVLVKVVGVSESAAAGHQLLMCGFSKELSLDVNFDTGIYVVSGGIEYAWKKISYKQSNINAQGFASFWNVFVSGNATTDEAKEANLFIAKLDSDLISELAFEGVEVFGYKSHETVKGFNLNPGSKRFFEYITSYDFCSNAVTSAVSLNAIFVPDPFGCGFACCKDSYNVSGNINILKFKSSNEEIFYIFQHVSSADAVFFPSRKIVFLIKHLPFHSLKNAMALLLKNTHDVLVADGRRNKRFLGVIASHGRPYHFYYDVAPAINDLKLLGLIGQVRNIIYYEGGNFCSFKAIYSLPVEERVFNSSALSKWQIENAGFCFHVGALFDESRVRSAVDFDKQLVSYSRQSYDYLSDADIGKASRCFPVIWFGVTVQKRSWIEQVDAAAHIFKELHKQYPTLGVVFDGWTSPLSATEIDRRETNNDVLVCNQIIDKLPASISTFNVVGSDSYKKIVYSRLVDAYIGNSATGGLHVARFCNRPGVGHLNTKLLDSKEHIRNSTVLVDKLFITDRPEDVDLRIDFISYSICWRVIYEQVLKILRCEGYA